MRSSFLLFFFLALGAHAQDFISDVIEGATEYDYDPYGIYGDLTEAETHGLTLVTGAILLALFTATATALIIDCLHTRDQSWAKDD